MIIREYVSSDLETLTELIGNLGYPTDIETMKYRMELIQSTPMYYTFVAELMGEVVGMIGVRQAFFYEGDGVTTQISALVSKPEHRGMGIGKALVSYVEEWAAKNGSEILYLNSGMKEERLKAHEFYKAVGFEITGYRFVKKL
jgi:GNAT superfamily N-acetyltransferase